MVSDNTNKSVNAGTNVALSKTAIFSIGIITIISSLVSVRIGTALGTAISDLPIFDRFFVAAQQQQRQQDEYSSSSSRVVQTSVHSQWMEQQEGRQLISYISDPQAKLEALITVLKSSPVTERYVTELPTSANELKGVSTTDNSTSPLLQTVRWVVMTDTMPVDVSLLVSRFALAYIYYNNNKGIAAANSDATAASNGTATASSSGWTKADNWLDSTIDHCSWYGVTCCKHFLFSPVCANTTMNPNGVTELDLYNNNLHGSIPWTIVLLKDTLQSLFLNENYLYDTINPNLFTSMPKLLRVNLQHNNLYGSVPDVNNGVMDTFHVHGNDLTGEWPRTMCSRCSDCPGTIQFYSLDCEEITCASDCCSRFDNCFVNGQRIKK